MNAALDFAVAQVRDRDLVIESLREQLERFREDAEEAQKVRGVLQLAAPAGYAVAHIKQMEADLLAAEAKLAEVERILNKSVTSRKATEKRLAEVEKERDKWSDHWEAEHEQLLALRASMDRARELAEKPLPKHRDSFGVRVLSTGWVERRMAEIARLLSGDEEERPNPAHPDWFPPDGTGKAE